MKLVVKAGLRERKDTREKINALIDAQLRTEEAMSRMAQAHSHSEMILTQAQADSETRLVQAQTNSETRLTQAQTNTDERLNALIDTVERFINKDRNGQP
jgi:hypothetical protein